MNCVLLFAHSRSFGVLVPTIILKDDCCCIGHLIWLMCLASDIFYPVLRLLVCCGVRALEASEDAGQALLLNSMSQLRAVNPLEFRIPDLYLSLGV